MDPAPASGTPARSIVFQDGLGERRRASDVSGADAIEMLCLRSGLTAVPSFEFALRERASRMAAFRHAYFSHVRSIDRVNDPASTLAVISDSVKGVRLSNLLTVNEKRPLTLDISAALHLLRQLASAIALMHETVRDASHGALGPERIIITPNARIVVVEYVLGAALEQLRFSPDRYWRELRIPLPPSSGVTRFDHRTDVMQLGVIALQLVLGRLLRDDEYPGRLGDALASASAVSSTGERQPLPQGLRSWIMRALQIEARQSFASASEASDELDRVLAEDEEERDRDDRNESTEESAGAKAARSDGDGRKEPAAESRRKSPVADNRPTKGLTTGDRTADRTKGVAADDHAWGFPADDRAKRAAADAPAKGSAADGRSKTSSPPPAAPPVVAQPPKAPSPTLEFGPVGPAKELFDEEPARGRLLRSPRAVGLVTSAAIALLAVSSVGVFGARRYFMTGSPAVRTGTININTDPPGAQVVVDAQTKGVTPLVVTLNAGTHLLELRGGGGEPRTMPVTVVAGAQVSQFVELPKAPTAFGQLQVRTEPPGAQVSIDGIPRGKSPVLIEALPIGEHAIVLESEVATVKQTVSIASGQTASLVVPLASAGENASASGWISIASLPVELQVYERGRLIGSSQSERLMLPVGKHEIELVNENVGYRAKRTVQVAAGKVASVSMEWPKGMVSINALPWADVWIDGERVGETPIGNLSLPIGPHELVFRHPDLAEQKYAVTVSLKAPVRVSVDLRKKP